RGRSAVDRDAAPGPSRAWRPREPNSRHVRALGEEATAVGNSDVGSGIQIDCRTRLDTERSAGIDRDIVRNLVRSARGRPNPIACNILCDQLIRAVVVPNVESGAGDLDVIGVQ